MIFSVVVDEEEVQGKIDRLVAETIDQAVVNGTKNWEIGMIIDNSIHKVLDQQIEERVRHALPEINKTLDQRIEAVVASLVKSKVQKQMKG